MTIGLLFWILMIVWFVFGAYVRMGGQPDVRGFPVGYAADLLIFILLLLLGIGVFGWPIKV